MEHIADIIERTEEEEEKYMETKDERKLNTISKKGIIHSCNIPVNEGFIWCPENDELYLFTPTSYHGISKTEEPVSGTPVRFHLSETSDKIILVFARP